MTRFINCWKYSKNLSFMVRLILAYCFIKLKPIFGINAIKIANKICGKKVLIESPFGNYLVSSQNEYAQMDNNYEFEIGRVINKISESRKNDEKYLINIGCNIGRWAIDCAKNYNYDVIAFEPAPENFDKLRINIALSKLIDKFEVYKMALGDEEGTVKFEYKPFHNGGSGIVQDGIFEGGEIINVPVSRFDDLGIEKNKIDNTRLIIMDVEGYEYFALKGMENSLKLFKDISIIVEIRENHKDKEKTIDYMKSLGYSAKTIDNENWLFSKQFKK